MKLNKILNITAVPQKAPVPLSSVIESQIDGVFEGWQGGTIVKLTNGQVWKQDEYSYYPCCVNMPRVFIYQSDGGYKMKVDGVYTAVRVIQLK